MTNSDSDTELAIDSAIEIPWRQLSQEALEGMLRELVTRDGTDYGAEETPQETRVAQLKSALENGRAKILFSSETETWSVQPCDT